MENKNQKPRCGICRVWYATGKVNEKGERLGYCDEFPMAGLITENCRCEGVHTPFKPKFMECGNGK